MSTIYASVSPSYISKVDRRFSNKLSDIFIELLQNARRAGATAVEVTTQSIGQQTRISFADNGQGIPDFKILLNLGGSEWDQSVADREDPAGEGFFSLVHSGVTVRSRRKQATISKAGFLGKIPVEVIDVEGPDSGTVLIFERHEQNSMIADELQRTSRYGQLAVTFNGSRLARRDFLEGAVRIKEVAGVRIGVFTNYATTSWNFYGRVIDGDGNLPYLSRVTVDAKGGRGSLSVRVDILDTQAINLKTPDRTAVVEDAKHAALCREAEIAMYEYLASLPEHAAQYSYYVAAHKLGVSLKEASPWFRTLHERPAWSGTDDDFFPEQSGVLASGPGFAIADREDGAFERLAFTFLAGLEFFHELPFVPIEDAFEYEGYSWYGAIPRIRGILLSIDGTEVTEEVRLHSSLTLADSIQLSFVLDRSGEQQAFLWDLPFAGFKQDAFYDEASLVITRSSGWARPGEARIPFDLVDAAVYIAFSPSEDNEADSSSRQLEELREAIHSQVIRTLGGRLALARHALNEALFGLKSDVSGFLRESNVSEIHLRQNPMGEWETELVTSAAGD